MTPNAKRTAIFLIPLLVFGLLIVMFFFRLGKPTDVVIGTAINKPLPDFSLPLLSDPSRTMSKGDLPKTPFLLNVWGSWCTTCYVEHPFLMHLHQQGVPIVGINYKDETKDALVYLQKQKDPFLYSLQDISGGYGIDLGLTGAPETFVVDSSGVVYQHITGEIHADNWKERILPCMQALGDNTISETKKVQACQ